MSYNVQQTLARLAQQKLQQFNSKKNAALPLPTSVEALYNERFSYKYIFPEYFRDYVNFASNALIDDVRAVFAAPPQSGKTTTTFAILLYACETCTSQISNAYVTYSGDIARTQMKTYVQFCLDAGFEVESANGWVTHKNGSKVKFTSISGALTSIPINGLIIVDDVFKSRTEAISSNNRELVWTNFCGNAMTRRAGHLSVIVLATRWHEDDLSGRLINKMGWPYFNFPAFKDTLEEQNILCTRRHSVQSLQEQIDLMGQKYFDCVYMGHPLSDDDLILGEPATIDADRLTGQFTYVYGLDAAYSAKGDWSVLTRLKVYDDVVVYDKTWRKQQYITDFCRVIVEKEIKLAPGAIMWHGSGQEPYIADTIKRQYIPRLTFIHTNVSKRIRAEQCGLIPSWRSKKIVIPQQYNNTVKHGDLKNSLEVVQAFTGNGDKIDDDFDSLVSAYTLAIKIPKHHKTTEIVSYRNDKNFGVGMFKNIPVNPRTGMYINRR